MNILLTDVYSSKNKGDAAITSVIIDQIKSRFPNSNITLSSMDDTRFNTLFDGIPMYTSFFYEAIYSQESILYRLLLTGYIFTIPILWVFIKSTLGINLRFLLSSRLFVLLQQFESANIVIGVGGAYLISSHGIQGKISLALHVLNIIISKLFGKTYVLYSQSIGPFNNIVEKYLMKLVLNKVDLIIVRENITNDYLKQIGVNKSNICFSPDAAFSLQNNQQKEMRELLSKHKVDETKTLVMVTVKKINENLNINYEDILANFLDHLMESTNCQLVFVPQSTSVIHNDDDRVVMNRIKCSMRNKDNIVFILDELDHYQTKSLYCLADFLIATRMHSAVFALTGFVPVMAIAYEHKTQGIMTDLGLGEWVIPVKNISNSKLINLFESLVKDKNKYINTLKKILPSYIEASTNTIDLVAPLMRNN